LSHFKPPVSQTHLSLAQQAVTQFLENDIYGRTDYQINWGSKFKHPFILQKAHLRTYQARESEKFEAPFFQPKANFMEVFAQGFVLHPGINGSLQQVAVMNG
jgi:hypothetical protein